ncbi:amidohydrolase family protein [Spirosoma sp. RP8]|uniref:Amidohydrolase family protein n=1 Tax=Spirosoma liriopis TaxID=2937440 RepID=A0ABT0HN16_9BACT|nr:amidohydrolase family protein [Spirosoma liriopis]MCK8493043.1 amidohydrolase family protein [Spirosoma liriopis]
MLSSSGRPLCIMGHVVDDQGRQSVKTILVQNGRIIDVRNGKVPISRPDAILLDLADHEVVFPGLINLHVHSEYNIFPLWQSPALWGNRFQWRNNEQYLRDIKRFKDFLDASWRQESFDFIQPILQSLATEKHLALRNLTWPVAMREIQKMYGVITELQAVAGGTTLMQQTIRLEADENLPTFVIRNTGQPSQLGIAATQKVLSVVDFVRPGPNFDVPGSPANAADDTSDWPMMQHPSLDDFLNSVRQGNHRYYATIAHLAEGRSGYLQRGKVDGFSRREFAELRRMLAQIPDKTALAKANLTLTHACGLDYADPGTLDFLRENGISIVWSPVSNLLLYGDTLTIKTLLDQGVNVCLGSDWAPSGSKHVWDELKFARYFCDTLSLKVGNDQLLAMVTQNPARALGGVKSGLIKPGYNADFFVLRKSSAAQTALDALVSQDDSAVRCTIVNGRVVYGEEGLFVDSLPVDYQRLPAGEGNAAARKVVSINSALNFNLTMALLQVNALMIRYATETLQQPAFQRTRLLAADDLPYQERINALKTYVADLAKRN